MGADLESVEWHADLLDILDSLQSPDEDLAACGSAVFALLSRLVNLLRTHTARSTAQATHIASHLLRLADEKLNSYPYKDVPLAWRRLYTDASLFGALARLAGTPSADERRLAVHDCDMAIVIAGAPGAQREDLALRLIQFAQAGLAAEHGATGDVANGRERPTKRPRRASPAAPAPFLHRPLPERPTLPSFLPRPTSHPPEPFIVRSAMSDTPAVARWSSLAYLRGAAGPARVVPVEVGGDYTAAGWGQRMMRFDTFLDTLECADQDGEGEREGGGETLYLAQHALFRQFPALRVDLPLPDVVYSAPDFAVGGEGDAYDPPPGEDGVVMNAWIGPKGTKSKAHTDPWWNCYVQVVGSKWIWVAPPDCAPAMAAFGSAAIATQGDTSREPRGDDTQDAEDDDGEGQAAHYMTNTSTLDVSIPPPRPPPTLHPPASSVAFAQADRAPPPKHTEPAPPDGGYYPPAFLDGVAPRAYQAVLYPGDVLVLPARWWHSLVSLERSFSVSMWF